MCRDYVFQLVQRDAVWYSPCDDIDFDIVQVGM